MKKVYLNKETENEICALIASRQGTVSEEIENTVLRITESVAKNGDKALYEFSERFDGVKLSSLEVPFEEIKRYYDECDEGFKEILSEAAANIERFHKNQKREGFEIQNDDGTVLGQRIIPLERVGIYVPGGTAAYPSSVLMNAVPAKVAGVSEIIMVTPPGKDGKPNADIMAAAYVAGVSRVFLIGGAQAVAALAYGTESVPKADKITGPGNIYVATAKRQLFGRVSIDMVAGPSEILIIADETADPKYVAADMLSQAEHDKMASAILVTDSETLAEDTEKEIYNMLKDAPRSEIAIASVENYGLIVVTKNTEDSIKIANMAAPEHLEIMTKNPEKILPLIRNAGSVFLGAYSPEPLGDYFAGPNHVLPTSGTARFFSPLSVDDFVKKSSYIKYTKEKLLKDGKKITEFAEREGLYAHANAVKVRMDGTK